jgi:hypothetical protein
LILAEPARLYRTFAPAQKAARLFSNDVAGVVVATQSKESVMLAVILSAMDILTFMSTYVLGFIDELTC